MTYEEQRAVEHAADLAKPFLQLQDWSKDHKYRPLLLEPVIDGKLEKQAAEDIRAEDDAHRRAQEATHAQEPGPPDYLDTEPEESEYEGYPENQPDRMIGERGCDGLKVCDMAEDLEVTSDELKIFAEAYNLPWPERSPDIPQTFRSDDPRWDEYQALILKRDLAMAHLLVQYGVANGICNKDGRFIQALEDAKADDYLISEPPDVDEPAAQEPEAPDYLDTEAPPDLWWPGCDDTPLNVEFKSAMAPDDYYAKLVTEQEHATKPDEKENA